MRDVSFVEAVGGKKEMNIGAVKCGIDPREIKVILSDRTWSISVYLSNFMFASCSSFIPA